MGVQVKDDKKRVLKIDSTVNSTSPMHCPMIRLALKLKAHDRKSIIVSPRINDGDDPTLALPHNRKATTHIRARWCNFTLPDTSLINKSHCISNRARHLSRRMIVRKEDCTMPEKRHAISYHRKSHDSMLQTAKHEHYHSREVHYCVLVSKSSCLVILSDRR